MCWRLPVPRYIKSIFSSNMMSLQRRFTGGVTSENRQNCLLLRLFIVFTLICGYRLLFRIQNKTIVIQLTQCVILAHSIVDYVCVLRIVSPVFLAFIHKNRRYTPHVCVWWALTRNREQFIDKKIKRNET